jgi:hypothetical protein
MWGSSKNLASLLLLLVYDDTVIARAIITETTRCVKGRVTYIS